MYLAKYLKYKKKYLDLKAQQGNGPFDPSCDGQITTVSYFWNGVNKKYIGPSIIIPETIINLEEKIIYLLKELVKAREQLFYLTEYPITSCDKFKKKISESIDLEISKINKIIIDNKITDFNEENITQLKEIYSRNVGINYTNRNRQKIEFKSTLILFLCEALPLSEEEYNFILLEKILGTDDLKLLKNLLAK